MDAADEMKEAQAAGATTWQRAMATDGEAMQELEQVLNALLNQFRDGPPDSGGALDHLHRLLTVMEHLALRNPDLELRVT